MSVESGKVRLVLEFDGRGLDDGAHRGSVRWLVANAAGVVIVPGPRAQDEGVRYGPQVILVSKDHYEMVRLAWWTRAENTRYGPDGEACEVVTSLHLIDDRNAGGCCQHALTPGAIRICREIVRRISHWLEQETWLYSAFVTRVSPACTKAEELTAQAEYDPDACAVLRDFLEDDRRVYLESTGEYGAFTFRAREPGWRSPPRLGWEGVRAPVGDEHTGPVEGLSEGYDTLPPPSGSTVSGDGIPF